MSNENFNTDITADEYRYGFEFLDELRESAEINMMGARAHVAAHMGWERRDQRSLSIHRCWMDTFDGDVCAEDRAIALMEQN